MNEQCDNVIKLTLKLKYKTVKCRLLKKKKKKTPNTGFH